MAEAAAIPLSDRARAVWGLFQALGSQWRVGFAGAYGLDYLALEATARILGVPLDAESFRLVQILEAEQLETWKKVREEKEASERAARAASQTSRGQRPLR